MLDRNSDPVAWALLLHELQDARDHLGDIIERMSNDGRADEIDYGIRLGHVFAHLNRAWHWRNEMPQEAELTQQQWAAASRYPEDLNPS